MVIEHYVINAFARFFSPGAYMRTTDSYLCKKIMTYSSRDTAIRI